MKSYNQYCALAEALDRVGGRWSLLIVRELLVAPRRFSELRASLPGIATNLLTERLRHLEEEGLLERRERVETRDASVYALTPRGAALEEAVLALVRWGGAYMTTRRPDQTFDGRWLVVALRALFPSAPRGLAVKIAMDVEGAPLWLEARGRTVRVNAGALEAPDVSLAAPGHLLLGVMSGALSLEDAERSGATVSGCREGRRLLADLVGSRSGPRAA